MNHSFQEILNTNTSQCRDTRYWCLQVAFDTVPFAEERIITPGLLSSASVQNEVYVSDAYNDAVLGSQLYWQNYALEQQWGALNRGLRTTFDYSWIGYTVCSACVSFYQYQWQNLPTNDVANLGTNNGGTDNNVNCGAFTSGYYPAQNSYLQHHNQSSADFGVPFNYGFCNH